MRGFINSAVIAMIIVPASAAITQAAVVQFSNITADSYASNFRTLLAANNGGTAGQDNTNQNFKVTSTSSGASNFVAAYDTDPSAAKTVFTARSFTLSADVRFTGSGSSFSFYIGDDDAQSDDLLALFNVVSSGNDLLNFRPGGNMATNGAGTVDTPTSIATASALSVNQTINVKLVATPGTGSSINFVLSASDGTTTLSTPTFTYTPSQSAWEFGFRTGTSPVSGSVGGVGTVDNFTVAVPEPTTLAGLSLVAGAILSRRRRA